MTDTSAVAFGCRARDARLARVPHMSQREIAEGLGWSQQKLSKVENGHITHLSVAEVHDLAVQLRVDEYYLFTGRHPHLSPLAMQIERLELDEYGEQAVLETARREAQRVADQRREFEAIQRQMLAAGIPRRTTERTARLASEIERESGDEELVPSASSEEGRTAEMAGS